MFHYINSAIFSESYILQFSTTQFKLLAESYSFLTITLTSFDSKNIKIEIKGI